MQRVHPTSRPSAQEGSDEDHDCCVLRYDQPVRGPDSGKDACQRPATVFTAFCDELAAQEKAPVASFQHFSLLVDR